MRKALHVARSPSVIKNKKLFTLVVEFDGGTYVSQIRSLDALAAITEWTRTSIAISLGIAADQNAVSSLCRDPPIGLEGLKRVWCSNADVLGELLLINIIETPG